jgi:UDP-3-O-acyl N-acetylglucosamine deacetylase
MQNTIARPVAVSGFGFWSGRDVRLQFRPAPADSGIVFVRSDLKPVVRIPARVDFREETPRRTTLCLRSARVEMVEHVLAALTGLRIDNCEVWVDAVELPGVDGSSLPFVTALQSAGIVAQAAPRPRLVVTEFTRVGDDEDWIEARPTADFAMSAQYRLDFGIDHPIGRETLRLTITPERFISQLAPARTFILKHEAEWLRQQGFALRVTPRDVLVFDERGLIDNELRFEDECVRHKVLDMIGDLSLAGCDLIGQFVAHRTGHRLNACLVQTLLSRFPVTQPWRASA